MNRPVYLEGKQLGAIPRVRVTAWAACLVVGGLASLAYYLIDNVVGDVIYVAIAGASSVGLFVGARRVERRLPWYFLSASVFLLFVAEVLWVVLDQMGLEPWPSVADVFYLLAYPVQAVTFFLLVRDRAPGRDMAGLMDAAVITVVMALLSWVFLMEPYVADSSLTFVELVTSVAYPFVDILMLAVLARLMTLRGPRSPAFNMLVIGLVTTLIGDIAYGYVNLTSGYTDRGWMDATWLIMYVVWGVAALHPSASRISDAAEAPSGKLSRERLVLLSSAALIAPGVMLYAWATTSARDVHVPESTAATAIVFILVLVRMGSLNRQIDRHMTRLHTQGRVLRAALDERNALAEKLRHQAFHDSLTGLPNRALFLEKVQEALEGDLTGSGGIAVLFIDLDEFKSVNDRFGHAAGDELLKAIGHRLRGALRAGDVPARLGGDEFGLLVYNVDTEDVARAVAQRLFASLNTPFSLDGISVPVKASVGVSLNLQGDTAQDLLRNSDAAMYLAKHRGKDRFEIFDSTRHGGILEQMKLRNDFTGAIERNELVLHYQPQVDLLTKKTVGAEALIRWRHPTRGFLYPNDFISLAEETGAIVPIGKWVLREACTQAKKWVGDLAPGESFTISVNLSARQLADETLVDSLADTLHATGLDPRNLILEMTESVLIQDEEASLERLRRLSRFGVRIAIDDFGTGYSSLTYLQRLPAEILKIDKSFIDNILEGPEEEALAHAIVRLGETLNLVTIAEGIETVQQASRLRQLGCPYGQGYHFSRPIETDAMTAHLLEQGVVRFEDTADRSSQASLA
jgi:diguanylate cyclase (GGDEF)-like protein